MKKQKDPTSLKSNIIWNSAGSLFYQACIWLMSWVVLRLSGPADNGIFAVAMAQSNMFFTVAIYGMRAYQSSDLTGKYTDRVYVFSRFLTSGAALLACGGAVLLWGYGPGTAWPVLFYMAFRISEALMDVLHGIDQRVMRMDIVGKSFLMRGVVSLAVFALGLFCGLGLSLSILGMAAASFILVAIYDVPRARALGDFSRPFSFSSMGRLLLECLPLVAYAFLNTAISNLPRVYLETAHGEAAAGIFSAISAPALLVQMGAAYLFTPLITGFAAAYQQRNRAGFQKLLGRTCLAVGGVGVLGVLGGFLLGEWGLRFLYGGNPDTLAGVMKNQALLVPVIVSAVVTAFVLFFNMLLTIIRDFKGLVAANAAGLLCCVLLCGPLIGRGYLQGTNLVVLLSLLVQLGGLLLSGGLKVKKRFAEKT